MIFVERLIEIWGALWYDKIKIEDRRKKEMSLIMTLSLLNGIVLTADSRVTCSKDGTVVGRADNENLWSF